MTVYTMKCWWGRFEQSVVKGILHPVTVYRMKCRWGMCEQGVVKGVHPTSCDCIHNEMLVG